jgi:transposase-like protein
MERREKFKCPNCDAPYVRREVRDCDDDDYDENFDYFEYICKSCNRDFRDIVKVRLKLEKVIWPKESLTRYRLTDRTV